MHIVIYTSDVHGNEVQYRKFFNYAVKIHANSIVIGGDLAPKEISSDRYIGKQRKFLSERLPSFIEPLKRTSPETDVYLMMGNDDCKANHDVLEKENGGLYRLIHNQRLSLTDNFDIAGYSCVPITPFGIKDWEKFDFSTMPEKFRREYTQRKETNYQLDGWKSTSGGWIPFRFTSETEKQDSIQKDLFQPLFLNKPEKTVYVMHSPPSSTNLDMISTGEHVGSIAERLFIEKVQPYLTLHGHIHETVAMSGRFRQDIGRTICLASGNHNVGKKVAILQFDLYNLNSAKRMII